MRYERAPVRANCPICQHVEGVRLYRIGAAEAAAHFVPEAQNPSRYQKLKAHVETLWRGETCEVIQCSGCNFCYAWPFRAGDATFYSLAYERTGYPSWKWEHQQTLDSIRRDVLPQCDGAPRREP